MKRNLTTLNIKMKGNRMKNDNQTQLDIVTTELRMIYYNNYLLEKGAITKREHEEMYIDIISESKRGFRDELKENSLEERLSKDNVNSFLT